MLRCVSTSPRLQLFSKLLGELQTYWYRQFALEKARCTKLVSQVLEITFNAPFAQLPTMRKGFPTLLGFLELRGDIRKLSLLEFSLPEYRVGVLENL